MRDPHLALPSLHACAHPSVRRAHHRAQRPMATGSQFRRLIPAHYRHWMVEASHSRPRTPRAMARLQDRMNVSTLQEGLGASRLQFTRSRGGVAPACWNRSIQRQPPSPAMSWPKNSRLIIMEVLEREADAQTGASSLRREGAGRRVVWPRPLGIRSTTPTSRISWSTARLVTYIEKKGKLQIADPVPRRGASVPDRAAHREQVGRRVDQTTPLCRRPPPMVQPRQRDRPAADPCAAPRSRSVSFPPSRSRLTISPNGAR